MTDPNLVQLFNWCVENSSTLPKDSSAENVPGEKVNTEAVDAIVKFSQSKEEEGKNVMGQLNSRQLPLQTRLDTFATLEDWLSMPDHAYSLDQISWEKSENSKSSENVDEVERETLLDKLIDVLDDEEAELRQCAATCISLAVQNNISVQQRVSPA